MKILAIRGENLASLSGQFEVSFESDPLKSSGLFAISGPTGSGKSTLLDALCLALYNKTPRLRLANGRGIRIRDVADEHLSQHDPRNLLRRGSAQAHAEVDFVGSDGIAYRARWSVRRSRGRSDGRLQQVEMSLLRLADLHPIGGNNNEVLPEIELRLGLNFEQFTRGVLLAQNEFSSFLKARDDERASLLETLTGTDIYSQISALAFERAKQELQQLEELKRQLTDRAPLDEAQRQALEKTLTQATREQNRLEARYQAAQTTLRWFTTLKELCAKEQDALQQLTEQQQAHAAAQPQRDHLALLAAVEPSRPLVRELDRLASALQAVESERSQAQEAQQGLEKRCNEQQTAFEAAQRTLQEAQEARQASAPLLLQARKLDALNQSLAQEVAQQQRQVDEWSAQLRTHQQEIDSQQREQQRLQADQQTLERWFEDHQGLQTLAEGWSGWQQRLDDAARTQQQAHQLQQLIQQAQARQGQLEARYQQSASQYDQLEAQIHTQERELSELRTAMGGQDLQALNESKHLAECRRQQLSDALTLQQTLDRQEEALTRQRSELAQQSAELAQRQNEMATLQPALSSRREEERLARIALDRARLAQAENVRSLRQQLEQDAPCPVCGSAEHPFVAQAPQDGDALLATLEGQWQQARHAQEADLQALQRATAASEQLDRSCSKLSESVHALAAEQQQTLQAWQTLASEASLCDLPEHNRSVYLKQALSEHAQQISALSEQIRELSRQHARHEQLQQALQQTQSSLRQQDQHHQQALLVMEKQRSEVDALQTRYQACNQDLAGRLQQLQPILPDSDCLEAWRAAPEACNSQLASDVEYWHQQELKRSEQLNKLQELARSIATAQQLIAQARRQQESEQAQLHQLKQRLQHQQRERATLFAGEPADLVDNRLEAALTDAATACDQARRTLQESKEQRSANLARLASKQEAGQQLIAQQQQAAQTLQHWLDAFNQPGTDGNALGIDPLRCLLEEDPQQRHQQSEQLQTLDRLLEKARVLAAERGERRREHEAARQQITGESAGEPLDESAAIEQEQALAAALKAAREAHGDAVHRLRSDDERRTSASALNRRIDAHAQQCRVWQQLNELIGSGDGRKFRNYAQQLTLDLLLQYANRHLHSLADRYRLGRIDDSLALQVIDRDMGDEVRSVHSLSGGESFLVSLALALGLASLSSNQVRVESLFIDEGFGSLDEETLRVAMEALDSLQAQGRKVGVITHVQEMIERITTQVQVNKRQPGTSSLTVVG